MKNQNNKSENYIDRFQKNRERQKIMYESYDFRNKNPQISKNKINKNSFKKTFLKNEIKSIIEKEEVNIRKSNKKELPIKQKLNIPNFIFDKITSVNTKYSKKDILNFEKNEKEICNNLLKGIEQLKNGKFIINSNILNKKESKEKQSITTKETETINYSDKKNMRKISLIKKNSKEKKQNKLINLSNSKRIIKIVFPKSPNESKTSFSKKNSPMKLKYNNNIITNIDTNKQFNIFNKNNSKNNCIENNISWNISSINSMENEKNKNSNCLSFQKSLLDFLK